MSAVVALPLALLTMGGLLVLISGQAELRRRWIVWVAAAGVLFAASHLPHGMLVLAGALAAVAGAELAHLVTSRPEARAACWLVTVATTLLAASAVRPVLVALVCASALAFPALSTRHHEGVRVVAAALWVGLPLAALAALPTAWTLPALLAVSVGDVAAWVGGRTLGRRGPLARGLSPWSPNKTWAGALASIVVGGLVLLVLDQWWLAALVPACGIVGDLRESQLKRRAGVKDAGTWLPGFGGLLDRIDSVLGALAGVCGSLAVVAGVQHPGWWFVPAGLGCSLAVRPAAARRLLWRSVFATTGGLTVHGRLPAGGCVVVASHASHADSAALLAALDAGHTPRVAAAADYWFGSPLRACVCRSLVGGFAVRRTGGGTTDLLATASLLRRGQAVVVYPSGSRDAGTGAWRSGAFRLAAEAGVPVVPVAITGTDVLLPKSGRFARHRVTVVVGAPIADAALAAPVAQAWCERLSTPIRQS